MKIKEASLVTSALLFLVAIATFFFGKVSSQKDHRHYRNSTERKVENSVKELKKQNASENASHKIEIEKLHKHYDEEEVFFRKNWNLPPKED